MTSETSPMSNPIVDHYRMMLVELLITRLAPTPTPPTREGAMAVLNSIGTFLSDLLDEREETSSKDRDVRLMHPATETIKHLATVLADLRHGVVDDIVAPQKAHNRPPMNATDRMDRLTAVATYKALRSTGMSRDDASQATAKAIAEIAKNEGRKCPPSFSAKQIINMAKKPLKSGL
jgi:hypothetical protein